MMRIWLTNKPLFWALSTLARAVCGVSGRVPPEERQRINVMFWSIYDRAGRWQR